MSKFRIQHTLIVGNYSQHIHVDKSFLTKLFEEKIGKANIDRLLISHETADEACPHVHTHFVIKLKAIWQTTNCRVFDFVKDGVTHHPCIEGKHVRAFKDCWNYICKEDNKDKLIEEMQIRAPSDFMEMKDVKEVINECKNMKEVLGALAIHDRVKKKPVLKHIVKPNWVWQERVLDMVKYDCKDDRKVFWFWEEMGKCGKTALGKWLAYKHGDCVPVPVTNVKVSQEQVNAPAVSDPLWIPPLPVE